MDRAEALQRLLRSPLSKDAGVRVRLHDGALRCECEETSVNFPTIGGVPCLFSDPDREIARWTALAEEFDRDTSSIANGVLAQLSSVEARSDVRRRLQRLHEALLLHRDDVAKILDGAGLNRREARAPSSSEQGRAINPVEARLDAYLPQIHRDWGWSHKRDALPRELGPGLEAIAAALGPQPRLGTMLVVGCGASRLPFEVHRRWADTTVALDVDVLAVTIAARIVSGDAVELHEFPSGPRDADATVVRRRLEADPATVPSADTFEFVFADGLDPPFRDGVFDTVFTPWFIDQAPKDLATFVPVVRRLLRPGGRWLNQGPLIYEPRHTSLMHRYTQQEVRAIVSESGFEVVAYDSASEPYLQSPASTRGRTETVLTFCAVATASTASPSAESGPPAWLSDPAQPIGAWEGLVRYRPPHPMFAAIIALIDGTRTANDIAEVMVSRHGLPQDAALGGVQAALAEMLRATQDVK